MMKGTLWLAVLLCGCASAQIDKPKPLGKIGRLGAISCPVDNGIRVLDVGPGSPADKAGVKPGDVITKVNSLDLTKPGGRKEFGFAVRSGNAVVLSAKRDNADNEFEIQPKLANAAPFDAIDSALFDAVVTGQRVAVAAFVTDVKTTYSSTMAEAMTRRKAGIRNDAETQIEGHLLAPALIRCGNYKVIDRNKTHDVLAGLGYKAGSTVTDSLMKDVGRMTGATYLLFAAVSNVADTKTGGTNETDLRLVEIETGNVLATARLTQKIPEPY
jgi:hypothetical protein